MPAIRLPFRRLNTQQWLSLAWVALALFYALFTVGALSYRGIFDYLGADYRAFLASAEIIQEKGFSQVYDLDVQEIYQRRLYDEFARGPQPQPYVTAPVVYLPVFLLPVLPFLLLPPVPGFVVWTLLNAAIVVLYLGRFMRAVGQPERYGFIYKALLSAAAFANLFFGQVSIWMLVFVGEFILAWVRGKDFRAGVWLAGLLLKPQFLLLLLPGLLIGRRFKILAGFALASLVIGGVSTLLVGIPGMLSLGLRLVLHSGDIPAINAHVMMNWRSLAVNLALLVPGQVVWVLAYVGMALTAVAGLALWVRPVDLTPPRFGIVCLGTYAATCAATWHAHTNAAMPTIALLLLVYTWKLMSRSAVELWLLIPTAVFPIAFLAVPSLAHNLVGLSLFAFNVYIVVWAVWKLWLGRRATSPAGTQ